MSLHQEIITILQVYKMAKYEFEVTNMYMHKRPQVQIPNNLQELFQQFRNEIVNEIHTVRTDLRNETRAVRTDLRNEIQTVRTELRNEIHAVLTELRNEIQAVRTELRNEIHQVQTDVGAVHTLAIETAITSARCINQLRDPGSPMVLVRYPNGRLPEVSNQVS